MRIVTLVDWPEAGTDTDLCSANYRNPTVVSDAMAEAILEPIYPTPFPSPTPLPPPTATPTPKLMTSGVLAMVASCPKGYSHEHWSNGSSSYSCLIEQWERDYAEDFGDVVTDEPVRIHDHNKRGYWGYGGVPHSH